MIRMLMIPLRHFPTMPGTSNQDEQNNRDIEQGEDSV